MAKMVAASTVRKFAFDVGWVFGGQGGVLLAGFVLRILLGRFLGAADLGLYTMCLMVYGLAGIAAGVGIPATTTKFVAEYKDDKENLDPFMSCGLINSAVFGIIAGFALFLLAGVISNLFAMPELKSLVAIVAIAVPFMVINATLLGLLNGLREMKLYSICSVCRSTLLLGLAVLLVTIGWGVTGAVLAIVFAEIAIFVLLLFATRNRFHLSLKGYWQGTKKLLTFSSRLWIGSAIFNLNTRMDIFLVGYFLTDQAVGIYAIALAISQAFLVVPNSIQVITYPAISEYYARGLQEVVKTLINKAMKYSFIILSTIGILVIFLSKDIILVLLKPEFLPAITPIMILVCGMIFYGSMVSIGSTFTAVGRPDVGLKFNLIALAVNLGLDIILVPRLGISGAAIGTAVSLSIVTILTICFLDRMLKVKTNIRWYVQGLVVIALVVAAFSIFKTWVNPYLLAGVLFGIYLAVVGGFLTKREDREDMRGIAKQIFRKSS